MERKRFFTMYSKFFRMQQGTNLLTAMRKALKIKAAMSRSVCGQKKDYTCGPWILDLENELLRVFSRGS